jgi:RNA recognition motif-containing protein
MYHLFMPYGNLLSVRIMVERETGRSRGFGFVSYDSPEAAAMEIKELNGYPVCFTRESFGIKSNGDAGFLYSPKLLFGS